MKDTVVDDGIESGLERQVLIDAVPLTCKSMPLDVKAVGPDPIEPDERRIEFLASIVVEARAVALEEPIFAPVPFALNVDRVVERRRRHGRQEARLQNGIYELLARTCDGGFFGGR